MLLKLFHSQGRVKIASTADLPVDMVNIVGYILKIYTDRKGRNSMLRNYMLSF